MFYLHFREGFGFYAVDFNDPKRKRTPKLSAYWFSKVMETGLLYSYDEWINEFGIPNNITAPTKN